MRRPVFHRWIRAEVLRLHGGDRFRLRELAAAAQGDEPRLKEPLLLWALAQGRGEALLALVWDGAVAAEYRAVAALLDGCDFADVQSLEAMRGALPKAYGKFIGSYLAAYALPETNAESKRLRRERARTAQLQKGVTSTQVSRALGLDLGNVNAFLKDGAVERVSLENATRIMKYLCEV